MDILVFHFLKKTDKRFRKLCSLIHTYVIMNESSDFMWPDYSHFLPKHIIHLLHHPVYFSINCVL